MIAAALGETDAARDYLQQALAINPYFSVHYAAEAQATLTKLQ